MECNKPYKCNQKHVTGYIHVIKRGQDGSMHCLRREDECEEKEDSERRKGDAVDKGMLRTEVTAAKD